MFNRRDFLKLFGVAATGVFLPVRQNGKLLGYTYLPALASQAILDPTLIPKYSTQLIVPPAMPSAGEIKLPDNSLADYYEITMKQLRQHILPPSMNLGQTPVWSYVKADEPSTYNYPGFTIEAQWGKAVRVKWINGLVDITGKFLPHLLPVDQTLHWANPPGPMPDMEGNDPSRYTGPVPMVTHVHGSHTTDDSDGFAEAWFLPRANNIPAGYHTEGTFYAQFKEKFASRWGVNWEPGTSIYQYPNDQRATTLWFHDHSLGMTRLNVYAGPAAFYLVRGGPHDLPAETLPGPAPAVGADPFGTYYEIPLAIQDRSFNADGTLFYPDNRAYFEGLDTSKLDIPFIPDPACNGEASDVSPIWNPEFFGNTIVVNGRTWPFMNVEKRRYRLRLLNGCDTRFLILRLVSGDPTIRPATSALPFWVLGNEGGFLPTPVQADTLLIAPAERFDVIVDFTNVADGTELYLINEGPDEPFGGGTPDVDFPSADPFTTGQVMKLIVGPITGTDASADPSTLVLPIITHYGQANNTRKVSLIEKISSTVKVITLEDGTIQRACDDPSAEFFGPTEAHLGIALPDGQVQPRSWASEITETPLVNDTEIWEIYNTTVDAHPIHIHLVAFEIVDRQALVTNAEGEAVLPLQLTGDPRPPDAWELGFKDTLIVYPGEVARVKAKFDLAGLYTWHCHILEHEDNEMMRPYQVMERRLYMPMVAKGG